MQKARDDLLQVAIDRKKKEEELRIRKARAEKVYFDLANRLFIQRLCVVRK